MNAERGSDKHGARQDDQMEREVEGLRRGAAAEPRAQEWHAREPAADDQPDVETAPVGGLRGGTPEGFDAAGVEARSELGRYLRPSVFPAGAAELAAEAMSQQAPDHVLDELTALPAGIRFANVAEVWEALGGARERR